MAPKKLNTLKYVLHTINLLVIALALFFTPMPVQAEGPVGLSVPDFSSFVENIKDGNAEVLKGVYVPEVLSLPVIQQPVGNPGFVSQHPGVVTQFSMAAEVGNVGLLAHNHLAGKSFMDLSAGDEVRLVYGDGTIEYFVVTELLEYQALQPYSPYSEFRDLETDRTITATELFGKVYRGERHVTFQVCIEENGIDAWGRLFVIAQPKADVGAEPQSLFQKLMFQINH
jgi:hypothetical protein